jgi:hypothetical protein
MCRECQSLRKNRERFMLGILKLWDPLVKGLFSRLLSPPIGSAHFFARRGSFEYLYPSDFDLPALARV